MGESPRAPWAIECVSILDTAQPDREASKDLALSFIESQRVMTVAVCSTEGVPWAAPVFYVNQGFRLYWLTRPNSRLGAYLTANPRAAIAILANGDKWSSMRGLQMEGIVSHVNAWTDFLGCARLFLGRFPELAKGLLDSSAWQKASGVRFFQLDPDACWLTDHARGFGNRVELDLRDRPSRP